MSEGPWGEEPSPWPPAPPSAPPPTAPPPPEVAGQLPPQVAPVSPVSPEIGSTYTPPSWMTEVKPYGYAGEPWSVTPAPAPIVTTRSVPLIQVLGAGVALLLIAAMVLLPLLNVSRSMSPRPPKSAADSGPGWAPMNKTAAGEPARWDPCQPIHYIVNLDHAPTKGLDDVRTAIGIIAKASGLRFTFEGLTDEAPDLGRLSYQPNTYGERWAPVLIGWGSARASNLAPDDPYLGIAVPIVSSDHRSVVSGEIQLNTDWNMSPGFKRPDDEGAVLVHELGHIIGLDHIDDPTQIMNPTAVANTLGAGDLRGLSALGAGKGCLPAPPPEFTAVLRFSAG